MSSERMIPLPCHLLGLSPTSLLSSILALPYPSPSIDLLIVAPHCPGFGNKPTFWCPSSHIFPGQDPSNFYILFLVSVFVFASGHRRSRQERPTLFSTTAGRISNFIIIFTSTTFLQTDFNYESQPVTMWISTIATSLLLGQGISRCSWRWNAFGQEGTGWNKR